MRERWLSGRAIVLHTALLVIVPGCAIAAWWQINRAQDGNQLSYLYSVMWPVFGLLGLIFWWMLINTDYDSVGLRGMRRQQAQRAQAHTQVADDIISSTTTNGATASTDSSAILSEAPIASAGEDPELAAYNARLAELAAKGAKTWRRREEVVVRRPQ